MPDDRREEAIAKIMANLAWLQRFAWVEIVVIVAFLLALIFWTIVLTGGSTQ